MEQTKEESSLKAKTAKGLFWGGLGNGIQQLCGLLFGIVLGRLLDAQDYGMIGMLAIFSAIAGVLLDGGFAAALINKQDAKDTDYNTVFWFNIVMGITLYVVLFFCAPLIAHFYKDEALIPLARVVFLSFVIGCTGTVHSAVLVKRLMVKQRMVVSAVAMILSGVVGVTLAFCGFSYWSLAIQTLTYMVLNIGMVWYISPWRPTLKVDMNSLREMLPFSIKIAVTNIFNQVNMNIMAVLLGKIYDSKHVGYYTQGNKWMLMGSSFVASMTNSVAQPVLASMANDVDRQRNAFRKMLRFISFVSFPVMLGIACIARELIVITISDKWLPSVPILQLLCLWGCVIPINNLYSNLMVSRGKSNIYLWNTVLLGLSQIAALLFSSSWGIYPMIICFIVINVGWVAVWNAFAKKAIQLRFIDALKDIVPFFLAALVTIGIAYYLGELVANMYLGVLVKIAVSGILYCGVMKLSGSVIFDESIQFILGKLKPKTFIRP